MKSIKVPRSSPVIVITLIILTTGLLVFLNYDKLDVHLWLNRLNRQTLDPVFIIINKGAEAWGMVIAMIIALAWNFRIFLNVALALGISSAVTQVLKQFVFDSIKRPYYYFKEDPALNVPFGVDLHESFAMPSGHTTAAFAMCVALALYVKDRRLAVLLVILASLMGYARIYLSQHFLVDVFAGALIGTLGACFVYWLLNKTRIGTRQGTVEIPGQV